jgi:hypothetical protein
MGEPAATDERAGDSDHQRRERAAEGFDTELVMDLATDDGKLSER